MRYRMRYWMHIRILEMLQCWDLMLFHHSRLQTTHSCNLFILFLFKEKIKIIICTNYVYKLPAS